MIRKLLPTPTPPTPAPAIVTVDDLCKAVSGRRKLPQARVGKAAVGRILMMLLQLLLSKSLRGCEMTSTIHAVYIYLMSPNLLIDVDVDREIFLVIRTEIDRSIARSEKARQRAAMRRAAREAAMSASDEIAKPQEVPAKTLPEAIAEPNPQSASTTAQEAAAVACSEVNIEAHSQSIPAVAATSESDVPVMAQPEITAEANTESAPVAVEADASPAPMPDRAATKRRRKRDDDEVAFVYKPPQERPPVAYVIDDDEPEPYDPYGVRRAVEMQTRYKKPVRYNHW